MNRDRWLVGGLVVSLVLNISIIGFLVGRVSGGGPQGPMFDPTMSITRALHFLPEPRRDELRPLIGRQMRSMGPSVRGLRMTQRELYAAIMAEPYSREELEDSLKAFREKLITSQESSHTAFIDVIDALSTSERRQLLEQMRSRTLRRRGEGRRPPGGAPR